MTEPVRVLVADDHPIYRDGLAVLLASVDGLEVVGTAADGAEAVAAALRLRPDVVVMDVQMPKLNGVEATRRLTGEAPGIGIVVLTMSEDDGTVFVGATDGPSAQAAIDRINAIANPQLPKIGERFLGTVVKTTDFGAFVSLLPGRDGLVHISKLGKGKRIAKVEDVVKVGDKLRVEIADIDNRGKISLIPVAENTDDAGDGAAAPADAATASS